MIDKNNIPKHIAIIMDGNGRWAEEKGLSRTAGHREGIKRVKEIIKAAGELGVKIVTFFAFSAENWLRSKREVGVLMHLLNNFLDKELQDLDKNNIKFKVIGRDEPIPKDILTKIRRAEVRTEANTGLIFVLALNYGGRQEILDAVKKAVELTARGTLSPRELDLEVFAGFLYTAGLPDPDLLIRTSGEMRLSNFLLWQLSYAELYFTKKYWPEFRRDSLEAAIEEYQRRERRFGGLDASKETD